MFNQRHKETDDIHRMVLQTVIREGTHRFPYYCFQNNRICIVHILFQPHVLAKLSYRGKFEAGKRISTDDQLSVVTAPPLLLLTNIIITNCIMYRFIFFVRPNSFLTE